MRSTMKLTQCRVESAHTSPWHIQLGGQRFAGTLCVPFSVTRPLATRPQWRAPCMHARPQQSNGSLISRLQGPKGWLQRGCGALSACERFENLGGMRHTGPARALGGPAWLGVAMPSGDEVGTEKEVKWPKWGRGALFVPNRCMGSPSIDIGRLWAASRERAL